MTPTNEDLLALAARAESWNRCWPGNLNIEVLVNDLTAALRVLVAERRGFDVSVPPVSDHQRGLLSADERQAIRDRALEDAAQAVSNRAAYWWDEATAADDAGRTKLSLSYEAKALACTELAAAIRAMKGTRA